MRCFGHVPKSKYQGEYYRISASTVLLCQNTNVSGSSVLGCSVWAFMSENLPFSDYSSPCLGKGFRKFLIGPICLHMRYYSWMRDQFQLRARNKDGGQSTCRLFLLKPKRAWIFVENSCTIRNSPITRQSNPLNATVNVMLVRSFWRSCLHIAWWWVSACRLATAVASMFDREKNNGLSVHVRWNNQQQLRHSKESGL